MTAKKPVKKTVKKTPVKKPTAKKTPVKEQVKEPVKKPVGRPPGLTKMQLKLLFNILSHDFLITNKRLAAELEISERALYLWKKTNPLFMQTYKEAEDNFFNTHGVKYAQNKIFNAAFGYKTEETTVKTTRNKAGEIIKTELTEMEKNVPMNIGALTMLLKGSGRASQLLKKAGLGELEARTSSEININFEVSGKKGDIKVTKGK